MNVASLQTVRPRPIRAHTCNAIVHDCIEPAHVADGDPIFLAVTAISGRPIERTLVRICRISPLGAEFVRPTSMRWPLGAQLDLVLSLAGIETHFSGRKIESVVRESDYEVLSVTWASAPSRRASSQPERRAARRWACGAHDLDLVPTGIAANRVRINDHVYFRVNDISRTGLQLTTSLRNKFLIPGMLVESTISFPTLAHAQLKLRVARVNVIRSGEKLWLSVGTQFVGVTPTTRALMRDYLLRLGSEVSVQQLREEGFTRGSAGRLFSVDGVRSEAEYAQVLALRREAYAAVGKLPKSMTNADMGDEIDARSQVLVAKANASVVGSVRLMYPKGSDAALRHDDYADLSGLLPPRDQIAEVSKLCTHPQQRGSDLFFALIHHVGIAATQARRRYVLMSCTDDLLPVYLKMGFKRLGVVYEHPLMRVSHEVLLVDVPAVVSGHGVDPMFWNLARGYELWRYIRRYTAGFRPTWLMRIRVLIWRMFAPLAFVAAMAHARSKQHEASV